MSIISVIALIVAWAATIFLARAFFKAGMFKLTAPIAKLLEAGFGWVSKVPAALVRLIALLELAGVVGLVAGQAVYEISTGSQVWAQLIAVAAAVGLALTMVAATIMHQARGESKYTFKMTSTLLLVSAIAALTVSLVRFN